MDILYKTSGKERYCELSEETVKDIALEEVIDYMTVVNDERKILRDIMVKIPINPEDINYRQQIVRDLMESDSLCSAVRDSIDSINVLRYYGSETRSMLDKDNTLMALLENLRELKVWVEVVESLYKALSENDILLKI